MFHREKIHLSFRPRPSNLANPARLSRLLANGIDRLAVNLLSL